MRFILAILTIFAGFNVSRAALFTNTISIDALVRSNTPAANYGAAGSLTVSGATATNASGTVNGIADSFIRVNTAGLVTALNSLYGPNNWIINGAALRVVELGAPGNNIFTRGKGAFEIRWFSNDAWTEGTGMPISPTTDGVVYTNELTLLTNTASLGVFTNAAANNTNAYFLALPAAFVADIAAGGDVGLYLTAVDPGIGFTFNSQNFGTATQRPLFILSAVPTPGTIGITVSGADVIITGTNGAAGVPYVVLSGTNLLSPPNQWMPVATNVLNASGPFSITATNVNGPGAPAQQFFILQNQ